MRSISVGFIAILAVAGMRPAIADPAPKSAFTQVKPTQGFAGPHQSPAVASARQERKSAFQELKADRSKSRERLAADRLALQAERKDLRTAHEKLWQDRAARRELILGDRARVSNAAHNVQAARAQAMQARRGPKI